jgi:hypothetical protein
MIRLVLIILVPVAIAGGLIYLFTLRSNVSLPGPQFYGAKEVPLNLPTEATTTAALPTPKNGDSLQERVKTLEASVIILNKKIDTLTTTLSKLTNTPIPAATPIVTSQSSTTTSSGPKSVYIPIGYGGSSIATSDYESLTTQQITINSSDYSGYKQAVLEVNFKIDNANGEGQARLFNSTDGTAILGSVVSTISGNYATVSSSGFNLSSGSKNYTLQLKSSSGYRVEVQLARIRIDY